MQGDVGTAIDGTCFAALQKAIARMEPVKAETALAA
jgi:hypothetical protein